jgi:hypothetical protein
MMTKRRNGTTNILGFEFELAKTYIYPSQYIVLLALLTQPISNSTTLSRKDFKDFLSEVIDFLKGDTTKK